MKAAIVRTGLILAAFGAVIAFAGKASAYTDDDVFLMTLGSEHVADQYSNSELTGLGHQVCTEIDQYNSSTIAKNIAKSIVDVYGLTYSDAAFLVGAAVGAYCPQFYPAYHREAEFQCLTPRSDQYECPSRSGAGPGLRPAERAPTFPRWYANS